MAKIPSQHFDIFEQNGAKAQKIPKLTEPEQVSRPLAAQLHIHQEPGHQILQVQRSIHQSCYGCHHLLQAGMNQIGR